MMRIGHGYDVHAFGEGDHVMLGGVRIANDRGLVAHSDGDVAFRNAMLKEFPQLKARIAELTRRAVTKLVSLDDNLCSARRQCE